MRSWRFAMAATLAIAGGAQAAPLEPLAETAASRAQVRAPLPAGYVQQEFIATIWLSWDHGVSTLVHIRRPADAARASGVAVVEAWRTDDSWPAQAAAAETLAASGHAMVSVVTTQSVVERLWRADPARYGPPRAPFQPSVIDLPPGVSERAVLEQIGEALRRGDVPGLRPGRLVLVASLAEACSRRERPRHYRLCLVAPDAATLAAAVRR